MPLPRWLARLNRRLTNPALRPLAGRLPYFGVVLHRGRTSGRVHRTPVNVFPYGDGFVIALTYGSGVDWVKNVLADGRCQLLHRRMVVELVDPTVLQLDEVTHAVPGWIRSMLEILDVSETLTMVRENSSHPVRDA
jgi:deazaflavin-dependent oxidoreductase (nitroreductase family)